MEKVGRSAGSFHARVKTYLLPSFTSALILASIVEIMIYSRICKDPKLIHNKKLSQEGRWQNLPRITIGSVGDRLRLARVKVFSWRSLLGWNTWPKRDDWLIVISFSLMDERVEEEGHITIWWDRQRGKKDEQKRIILSSFVGGEAAHQELNLIPAIRPYHEIKRCTIQISFVRRSHGKRRQWK